MLVKTTQIQNGHDSGKVLAAGDDRGALHLRAEGETTHYFLRIDGL